MQEALLLLACAVSTSSASAVVRPELHLSLLVAGLSRHRVEDLQSRPRLT
jgi:ABC-type enterochelin transport system permease subunit